MSDPIDDNLREGAAEKHLKRCPLCGADNEVKNEECFVCRWQGSFDHDPVAIEMVRREVLSLPVETIVPTKLLSLRQRSYSWILILFHPEWK